MKYEEISRVFFRIYYEGFVSYDNHFSITIYYAKLLDVYIADISKRDVKYLDESL